jgi:EAL and modified HD-GYP domain-containing signal transduction protein
MFARQAIYSANHKVVAFELLYRGEHNELLTGAQATSTVLVNHCNAIVSEGGTIDKPVFLNIDEEFILSDPFIPFNPQDIVLEILETVRPTQAVLEALNKLRSKGFKFALDDYEFEKGKDALIAISSFIKVDVLGKTERELSRGLKFLLPHNKILLAEKVESLAMFDLCKKLGFKLFQGYHLERPQLISGKKIEGDKQILLNLVATLSHEDVNVDDIADLISAAPSLLMSLLKIVNSTAYSFKRVITSVRDAVILLGIDEVRQWVLILSLVSVSSQPSELFRVLLARAKACELYAAACGKSSPHDYFLIGLFSGLDALLEIDLQTIIDSIKLPAKLRDDILGTSISRVSILTMVKQYESVGPLTGENDSSVNGFSKAMHECYWRAQLWADEMMKRLNE